MAIDSTTAQTHLDAWLAADLAVSKGQEFQMGNDRLSHSDADRIRRMIQFWSGELAQSTASREGPRVRGVRFLG